MHETIVIIDLGSQTTQLIARRIRELQVFSQILPFSASREQIAALNPRAIILSGGPASTYASDAPQVDRGIFELDVPILGICYGLQLIAEHFGGKVEAGSVREFGRTRCEHSRHALFSGLPDHSYVWMSHGDKVTSLSNEFRSIAQTEHCATAALAHEHRSLFGVQFHPEVTHSEFGRQILENFCRLIAGCHGDWTTSSLITESVEAIQATVGDGHVVCGLSGGVDSAVAALLVDRAVGAHLTCIFVDNGLLRAGEREEVERAFRPIFQERLRVIDARQQFLNALAGVTDPEDKRKRIGHVFIDVFKDCARSIKGANFLAQGTLYPDVVESSAPHGGPTAKIKSHHNVGGLPSELGFKLVEPLRLLFKDEVRRLGEELGLASALIARQPFPGPGLAIRILGEVRADRLAIVRAADAIVQEEFRAAELHDKVWQSFAVLLPVQSVGVMGDKRTYEDACVLRVVSSSDGMTADWFLPPRDLLTRISNRIINEVKGINRVCLDISSKPPATIEWE